MTSCAGMRLAVAGKGGAGKSVIAGTVARLLARRGESVLAINGDFMPGLPCSMGVAQSAEAVLSQAVQKDGAGWRLKRGIGPVAAIRRFATVAPDGVWLLDLGDVFGKDRDSYFASVHAFVQIVDRLDEPKQFKTWSLIGDYQAGSRSVSAYDWARFANTFLIVMEPTRKSASAALRISHFVRSRPGRDALFIANKATRSDSRFLERIVGEPIYATIPLDDDVLAADKAGLAPLDHSDSSSALVAIEQMVDALWQTAQKGRRRFR